MVGAREVQYLVLPDPTNPYLLARVRWPDVCQAISPAFPNWQDDPGLFDLPYDPSSTTVTLDRAAAIAAVWGARLPADGAAPTPGPSLVRRMPADWSNLSRAEKRAWSIEFLKPPTPLAKGRDGAKSRFPLGRWRRRRQTIDLLEENTTRTVIDLTDTRDDALATVEDT